MKALAVPEKPNPETFGATWFRGALWFMPGPHKVENHRAYSKALREWHAETTGCGTCRSVLAYCRDHARHPEALRP